MNILIDTNILIPLEDTDGVLKESYSNLYKIAKKNGHQIFIHPGSLEDLKRDRNDLRKRNLLSKANKYPQLDTPPQPSKNDLDSYQLIQKNENDRIDNLILFSLIRSCVHLLITEDRGIHTKARKIGFEENVHYIQQALFFLEELHDIVTIKLPEISAEYVYNLKPDDPFFNSLKNDYPEFDSWFQKISKDHREAWTVKNSDGRLSAILIFKEENNEIVTHDKKFLSGKILKLCTFKVGETIRGRKIGELFIKMAFEFAIANQIRFIYLTIRPGLHDHLKDLCEEFGFYNFGMCSNNRDTVYLKKMYRETVFLEKTKPFEYYRKYHPYFICNGIKKVIIPIQPKYHRQLFPEYEKKIQRSLFPESTSMGNTLKKAYLCHSRMLNLDAGDLILFYRSQDQILTSIGIIERHEVLTDVDEICKLVSKRTVYLQHEIQQMAKKETKVILFRLIKHFKESISRKWLNSHCSLQGNFQTIRKINDSDFETIMSTTNKQLCADDPNEQ